MLVVFEHYNCHILKEDEMVISRKQLLSHGMLSLKLLKDNDNTSRCVHFHIIEGAALQVDYDEMTIFWYWAYVIHIAW